MDFSDYSFIAGYAIIYLAGALTVFVIFHRKIFNNIVAFNSVQRNKDGTFDKISHEFYALLSSNIDLSIYANTIEAIEIERERIGADAHDELAAHITSLAFDLDIVTNESSDLSIRNTQILLKMRKKIDATIVSLRRIIFGMVPATLDRRNLVEAIKALCDRHESLKGTHIFFRSLGQPFDLTDRQNLYLYRIVQELVNNSLKHSLAWRIFVSLDWSDNDLKIKVTDNGVGLPTYVRNSSKYGITGIFLRCMVLGAHAKFNTPLIGMEFELTLARVPIQKDK